jgi:hypothetical protein
VIPLLLATAMALAQDEPPAADDEPPAVVIVQSGYLDLGWFDAQGDGVAYERDVANRVLGHGDDGRFAGSPWVFYGDPWANAVNSQGDSADLGLDRTNIDRFDPIASGGRPTFLVNRFHHHLDIERGRRLALRAGINVEPRAGQLGRLGDVLELDTAYISWSPVSYRDLTFVAGRIESGFGQEYLIRHAPDRFGITPSIVARYLIGRQTGVRIKGMAQRWFSYSLAVTTGSSVDERFGHLSDDLDSNGVPTVTARVGGVLRKPVRLQGGVSGQLGPQDGQPDPSVIGWQAGVDARLDVERWTVSVEGVLARYPGDGSALGERLRAQGGFVEVQHRTSERVGLYGRLDWRDAELKAGPNYYVSDVLRWTAGARVRLDRMVVLKAEYLHLDELPFNEVQTRRLVPNRTEIRDDVITTSLVFHYRVRGRSL